MAPVLSLYGAGIGQVYSSLQRLERDGLVQGDEDGDRPVYRQALTCRAELDWLEVEERPDGVGPSGARGGHVGARHLGHAGAAAVTPAG